ncbi:MAG: molecular chaperone DnaJ [Clostridia bacterium]|jgi:molecular chaperone DnaJ|nr:molecular chaperone DnaJ [Clostridia bacterium]
MKNPYEVLGVREGSSIDEIKKAYKELVRKYHPDQYQNHPLSDLAEEKLKEINEAYDTLSKQYEGGSYANNSSGYRGNDSSFAQARNYINTGNIMAAEQLLDRSGNRTAEWFYLKGVIFMRKGWYNEAHTNLQTACSMEPNNLEYRNALNAINNSNRGFQSSSYNRRGYGNDPDMCQICSCLYCADCCCECGGGDFIGCC